MSRKARSPQAAGPRSTPADGAGSAQPPGRNGSLVVIGTGIRTVGQLTIEAIAWMERAEALLYVVGDPIAEAVMQRLNPKGAVSMAGYYQEGQQRMHAYTAMVEHILGSVRGGAR